MTRTPGKSVLIVGGYGLVGSHAARLLRRHHPATNIAIAGRHPERGETLVTELQQIASGPGTGDIELMNIDVSQPIRTPLDRYDVVVVAVPDPKRHLTRAALAHNTTVVPISEMADEIAPGMALTAAHGGGTYIAAGHWQAGVVTLTTVNMAQRFDRVDAVTMTAIFDPADPVGPASADDADHMLGEAMVRQGGVWTTLNSRTNPRRFAVDGDDAEVVPIGTLDVPALAAVTDADDVRFEFGMGTSVGTRSGTTASHDIYVELRGVADGTPTTARVLISGPHGGTHLTGLGVFLLTEHLLTAGTTPGWHLPESIMDAHTAVERAVELGVSIVDLD
ncbi:saccharopine dehydrogenase-like protein [Stackebrandtia endophytica]|uniref:Saccharopine dehydrogenase-like protein n=1 Tax=Stackebrandtia endophytica TaxID=1496996 RepID=A0A543AVN7_9ACTN|nr:saccharopine dehydrogenase NADP-binding domain-containing protein [Stackebrandtia endophytica]TQL76646.1 saccharopine dehydrogenase-like protein [Stackebrandtia endophytica]